VTGLPPSRCDCDRHYSSAPRSTPLAACLSSFASGLARRWASCSPSRSRRHRSIAPARSCNQTCPGISKCRLQPGLCCGAHGIWLAPHRTRGDARHQPTLQLHGGCRLAIPLVQHSPTLTGLTSVRPFLTSPSKPVVSASVKSALTNRPATPTQSTSYISPQPATLRSRKVSM